MSSRRPTRAKRTQSGSDADNEFIRGVYQELDEGVPSSDSDSDDFGYGSDSTASAKPEKKKKKQSIFASQVITTTDDELFGNQCFYQCDSLSEMSLKETPLVQSVLGVKGDDDVFDSDENIVYYVKWTGKSHIHCSWVPKDELMEMTGGENAIRKFNNRRNKSCLTPSMSIPSLMTLETDELSSTWMKVERVIGENEEGKFLVKWCGLAYDQCTWEDREDVKDEKAIQKFRERKSISHPIRIEQPRMVDPKRFHTIDDPLTDNDGLKLRDYQVRGFNWLRFCWFNGCNSILADEMGLGKTVQIVATINDIVVNHHIGGPFLVLAPLSTLPHWKNEFERWSNLNPVIYHGTPASKELIQTYEMFVYDAEHRRVPDRVAFDVLISNYETFMSDYDVFSAIQWRYVVLDEGHRLKNHAGKCYQQIQQIKYEHCTLLTGTPVQNNVEELWSLLHLLHPHLFNDLPTFLEHYGVIEDAEKVAKLQKVIKPFLLRRKKSDVDTTIAAKEETIIEVELTRIQKTYYRALLQDNASTLLSHITGGVLPSLLNLMMQLRKVCNHPFLLKGVTNIVEEQFREKLNKPNIDEAVQLRALVEASGKMILIDKLLPKLREGGHKVLIFSQMVKVLDILEEYFGLIGYPTERIDGRVPENDRQMAIDRFAQDQNAFVFLLCTRAGGVGINLTAADTVIIYDSDWNPQNDLQAESRCHRIGQTSTVKVYRLVTRGTYELEMLDRASKKLGLDHALLDGGEINPKQRPMAAREVEKLLRTGVYNVANDDDTEIEKFCEANIDQILEDRTTSFTRDVVAGGNSVFSKAMFNADNDNLDMEAENFWALAMPHLALKKEEELPDRRCKRTKNKVSYPEGSDDENDRKKRRRMTGSGQLTPKLVSMRIMHGGYKGSSIEKVVIAYAATTLEEPLEEGDVEILKRILDLKDLTEKTDEMENAERRLSAPLAEFSEKKDALIKRVIFYYRITQTLTVVQEPLSFWPVSVPGSDPVTDYAILYGVNKNGLGCAQKVLEGVAFEASRSYSDKQIFRICSNLVASFASSAEQVLRCRKAFLEPMEWKAEHEELFNRDAMSDEELISLLQTVTYLGFPETKNEAGEFVTDWQRIAELSRLSCLSLEAFRHQGEELQRLANDELDSDDQAILVDRLGAYGNKVWTSRLRTNNKNLSRVRAFVANMSDEEREQVMKLRVWDQAPDWWDAKQDLGLLMAISDYGLLFVATWIVDPERPFVSHLPEHIANEYQKIAEVEKEKGRTQKPKDGGELAFLFSDKIRVSRALTIIQYVETRLEKQRRRSAVDYEDSPEPYYVSEITEIPKMPLELGNQLTVLELGEYTSASSQYPVGYRCHRQYFSIADPTEKSWYEAITETSPTGSLQFKVTHLDDPPSVFVHHTSSGVWEQVIQEVQRIRGKMGLTKRKHTTVSGPSMYGFSHNTIASCFRLMKAADMGSE